MHHDHAISIVAPGSQPTWSSGPCAQKPRCHSTASFWGDVLRDMWGWINTIQSLNYTI